MNEEVHFIGSYIITNAAFKSITILEDNIHGMSMTCLNFERKNRSKKFNT